MPCCDPPAAHGGVWFALLILSVGMFFRAIGTVLSKSPWEITKSRNCDPHHQPRQIPALGRCEFVTAQAPVCTHLARLAADHAEQVGALLVGAASLHVWHCAHLALKSFAPA